MKKTKSPSKKRENQKAKKPEEKIAVKEEKNLEEEVEQLEKEIDKEKILGEMNFEEFEDFFEEPEFQTGSPSLRKINSSSNIAISATNLEQDLRENTSQAAREEDSFKYISEAGKEEPKYTNQGVGFVPNILSRTEIENLGKANLFERQEIRFANSPSPITETERNFEKYNPVSRVDKEKFGKENPLERKEIKYKP